MEHFWTPFFTFLSGLVVAVLVPIVVWKLAQIKETNAAHRADADEEHDYELECVRWADYSAAVERAFGILAEVLNEGDNPKVAVSMVQAAISARPKRNGRAA